MEINEIRFLGHAMDRLRAFTSNGVDYGAES
jgi:hypothetical protein